MSPDVYSVENEPSTNLRLHNNSEVLPDVPNTISHFSANNTSFMEIPNTNNRQISHTNQIYCNIQCVLQNDIKRMSAHP